jgi:molybdate transport system substrate-binding protein
MLDKKALKLTGGANSPEPPVGRSIYGMVVEEGKADIVLTYCTSAVVGSQPRLNLGCAWNGGRFAESSGRVA